MEKLKLLKKPEPEPPDELVEEILDGMVHTEMFRFADQIETARSYWRRYPELIEAPEFPEPFRSHYVEEYDCEPSDNWSNSDVDVLDPNLRENLRPKARRSARVSMRSHSLQAETPAERFNRELHDKLDAVLKSGDQAVISAAVANIEAYFVIMDRPAGGSPNSA
jgi:hypothetical protein